LGKSSGTSLKNLSQKAQKNLKQRLLFQVILSILLAMTRFLLLMTGITWAALMLLSWSGPIDASSTQPPTQQETS